jgi:DNA-binding transcriptional ArsR family regulator
MKKARELEKILKGAANHRRIDVLRLLEREPELSMADIAAKLSTNGKTISEHILRLARAGLVMKRYAGREVRHALTARARSLLTFLRMLE